MLAVPRAAARSHGQVLRRGAAGPASRPTRCTAAARRQTDTSPLSSVRSPAPTSSCNSSSSPAPPHRFRRGRNARRSTRVRSSQAYQDSTDQVFDPCVILMDNETGKRLDCVVRRRFSSKSGENFVLLTTLDMPIEIMRDEEDEVEDLEDGEIEQLLAPAAASLAERRLFLQNTAYCLTARGCLRYNEEDIFTLETGELDSEDDGEGIEVAQFESMGEPYVVYTPVEPLLFVATVADDGSVELLPDERLDEDAVVEALNQERVAIESEIAAELD